MTEARPRRSRLAQIKEKIADEGKSLEEEMLKASQVSKKTVELNEESKYKEVEIKDVAPIEETTVTTTKTLALTQEMMRRLETLEIQQKNDVTPRFASIEEKITENAKNISELLELLKNQPAVKELDYKLDPEPTPEPEPEMEPLPDLPPLPELEDEPPLDLEQESEPELPPLPELKIPEEEKVEEPKQEVPKMDSETQTDPVTLPSDEEREKRREERRKRHQKTETNNNNEETLVVKERSIQIEEEEEVVDSEKENIEKEEVKTEELPKEEEVKEEKKEEVQALEEKAVDINESGAGGCKLSFELLALITLIILELAHLYVISK